MSLLDMDAIMEKLNEHAAERMAQRLEGSWAFQHRSEQRRRMGFLLRMAEELKKIRDSGVRFSSAWAEWAMEAVITGDLRELKMWGVDGLSLAEFEKNVGPEHAPRYAEVYAGFREICEEALLTAKPMEKV